MLSLPTQVKAFLTGNFVFGVSQSFLGLFMNLHLREVGLADHNIARSLFLFQFCGALGTIPSLYFISRLNLHSFVIVFSACSIFAVVLALLLPFGSLTLPLFCLSFASVAALKVASAPFLMASTQPKIRPYVFSLLFVGTFGSSLIGNILGGAFAQSAGTLQIALANFLRSYLNEPLATVPQKYGLTILFGQLFAVLSLLSFARMSPPATSSLNPQNLFIDLSVRTNWRGLRWKFFAHALVPHILISLGAGLVMQFLNLYLVDSFGLTDRQLGVVMSLQSITMIFGVVAAPAIADRFGRVNTVIGTQIMSLPFMVVLAVTTNWPICLIALILRAMFMNMSSPISDAYILEQCSPTEQSVLNALKTITWTLSWACASLLHGAFFTGKYELAFIVATSFYLLASICYGYFFSESGHIRSNHESTSSSQERVTDGQKETLA